MLSLCSLRGLQTGSKKQTDFPNERFCPVHVFFFFLVVKEQKEREKTLLTVKGCLNRPKCKYVYASWIRISTLYKVLEDINKMLNKSSHYVHNWFLIMSPYKVAGTNKNFKLGKADCFYCEYVKLNNTVCLEWNHVWTLHPLTFIKHGISTGILLVTNL